MMMVLMNEERVVMVTVSLRWQPLFLQFAGKSHHWTQCSVDTHSSRPWTSLEIPGQHISCNDDDDDDDDDYGDRSVVAVMKMVMMWVVILIVMTMIIIYLICKCLLVC